MAMDKLHDLFIHELADMYDGEQQLIKALGQVEQETTDPTVRRRVQDHLEETRQQAKNLERCFESLGRQPKTEKCKGIAGILDEKVALMRDQPSKEVLQVINLAGSAKIEHYEIASYEALIELARVMGHTECQRLLTENLRQEEQMARFLEQHAPTALDKVAAATGDKDMAREGKQR